MLQCRITPSAHRDIRAADDAITVHFPTRCEPVFLSGRDALASLCLGKWPAMRAETSEEKSAIRLAENYPGCHATIGG